MIQLNLEPGTSTLQVTGIKIGTNLFSINTSEIFRVRNIKFVYNTSPNAWPWSLGSYVPSKLWQLFTRLMCIITAQKTWILCNRALRTTNVTQYLFVVLLPWPLIHVIWGWGNPWAWQWTISIPPASVATSSGSNTHWGATVKYKQDLIIVWITELISNQYIYLTI